MNVTATALLAIDRAVEVLNFRGARASADELAAARAALADLIDAYRIDLEMAEFELKHNGVCTMDVDRARDALARVQGGAA